MRKLLALSAAAALLAGSSAMAQTGKSDDNMKSGSPKSETMQMQQPNSGAAPATTGAAPRDATGASTPVKPGAGGLSGTASGTTGTDKNPKPASSVR